MQEAWVHCKIAFIFVFQKKEEKALLKANKKAWAKEARDGKAAKEVKPAKRIWVTKGDAEDYWNPYEEKYDGDWVNEVLLAHSELPEEQTANQLKNLSRFIDDDWWRSDFDYDAMEEFLAANKENVAKN